MEVAEMVDILVDGGLTPKQSRMCIQRWLDEGQIHLDRNMHLQPGSLFAKTQENENMDTHYVKSWSYLFQAAKRGEKLHDIRDMRDRDYKVGDVLVLEEFDQSTGEYTGDTLPCRITYITSRQTPCALSSNVLDYNHAILSIEPIDVA